MRNVWYEGRVSLGWVIFWKSIVVAVLAACGERWTHMKRMEAESGLPMRQGKDGVYRACSRLLTIEKWARRIFWVAFPIFVAYSFFVAYVLVTQE